VTRRRRRSAAPTPHLDPFPESDPTVRPWPGSRPPVHRPPRDARVRLTTDRLTTPGHP